MVTGVCEGGVGKSITSALHDTISPLHAVGSVCKGFSVVFGCAGRPSQDVVPPCNWSGPMQYKLFDKGVSFACCESAYLSEAEQS